jgi:hypothetical protein
MALDERRLRRLAATVTGVALTLAAASVVILGIDAVRGWIALDTAQTLIAVVIFALTFPLVGWVVLRRVPTNLAGWVYLAVGFWQALNLFSDRYSTLAYQAASGNLPFAPELSWIAVWAWVPGFTLFATLGILLFPDGRLPSRRWWPVAALAILSLALSALPMAIASWPYRGAVLEAASVSGQPNLPTDPALDVAFALGFVGQIVLLIAMVGAVAGLITRFRRSVGVERQQLKWFTYAAAVDLLVLVVWTTGVLDPITGALTSLLFALVLPIAIVIAILRHGLYDIDKIISRTAVYVPLTAALAGVYAASIALFQRLFIATTGSPSDGAVILSTLVLATTFTPIKNALQGFVDRRFREAHDAERRLGLFVDAVADGLARPDPTRTVRAFLTVAVQVSGAAGGRAYVWDESGERQAGETGSAFGATAIEIPLEVAGRRIGRIDLAAPGSARPYSDRDTRLLLAAGERVAAAALGLNDTPTKADGGARAASSLATDTSD